jgi:hypothetical protein
LLYSDRRRKDPCRRSTGTEEKKEKIKRGENNRRWKSGLKEKQRNIRNEEEGERQKQFK